MRAAVLGHPIAHSLSPVLHRAAYRALGLDWSYDALDVTEDSLVQFLGSLDHSWAGLSLTMPLKRAVMPLLDSITDTVRAVGGANTVVFADGGRHGHNTDVIGIVDSFREAAPERALHTIGVIGAGATAAAALIAARDLGASRVKISARRAEVVAAVGCQALEWGVPVEEIPWSEVAEALACDAVIVTLPGDAGATLLDDLPAEPGLLLDVTYHPWPTTVAREWHERGGPLIRGYQMLLWQAAAQVRLMTGQAAPVAAMAAALNAAVDR